MVRIVIPIAKFEGDESIIFQHFGRSPQFAVVDLSDEGEILSIQSRENVGEHFGGHGQAATIVSDLRPDALIVKGMGPRGLNSFQSKGIAVFTPTFPDTVKTVGEAVRQYVRGALVGMTEPCREARHRF